MAMTLSLSMPIFQAARLRASERDDGGASLVVPPDVPVDVGLVAGEDGDVGDARAVAVEAGPGVEAGVAVGGAGEGDETLGFGLVVSRGGARRERVARSRGERHVGGDATRRELDRAVDARLANREDARRERDEARREAKAEKTMRMEAAAMALTALEAKARSEAT